MKKLSIRNILVPIDFSKMSIQAIETAKGFAQRFGATIHLAHVHQFAYPAEFMGPVFPAGELPESFEEHRSKELAEQLKTVATRSGLSARDQTHLRTGVAAFDEICRLAQEIPADLIVMPTHGRTGLKHVFLGSTAEQIVQHSPYPVFVARQKRRRAKTSRTLMPDTILVPVDFSGCSLEGLKYAISFADSVAARLIVFHTVYLGYAYTADGFAMYDLFALEDAARKNAERQMRQFLRAVKFGAVKHETAITPGWPVAEICAFAKARDVDLIITATHGLTGLKHVLIGSIAEQVVRHAPCPVLVVPSHPTARAARLARGAESARKARLRLEDKEIKTLKSSGFIEREKFTRKYRKLTSHPFPERRKTNKFRESHVSR
jgi:nucleotide-binding universal stress UspA family protein